MKKILFVTTILTVLGLAPAFAQPGPAGRNLHFDAAISKLFGSHHAFSATMEMQSAGKNGNVTMPCKMSFDGGKTRFEMNMSEIQGAKMPPGAAEHMKEMGMETSITISRPDLQVSYMVFPGLQSYAVMPIQGAGDTDAKPDDLKMETTELGKETIDGHDCVKNKAVVTDKDGTQHESTIWNATDLDSFPVKIVTTEKGTTMTMTFKDISFDKPAASQFEAPSGYTKYDDMQTMMRTEMMKHMGMGMPPGQQ